MSYLCQYKKYHQGSSWREIWCQLPIAEGYCYIAGAMAIDGFLQFSGVSISDGAYIKQEVDKIMKHKTN